MDNYTSNLFTNIHKPNPLANWFTRSWFSLNCPWISLTMSTWSSFYVFCCILKLQNELPLSINLNVLHEQFIINVLKEMFKQGFNDGHREHQSSKCRIQSACTALWVGLILNGYRFHLHWVVHVLKQTIALCLVAAFCGKPPVEQQQQIEEKEHKVENDENVDFHHVVKTSLEAM